MLLEVRNLKTYFYTDEGIARAVDDVSFSLEEGETLGVVGESGCGKSVTALSILRLIPQPPGKIVSGSIHFNKRGDLTSLPEDEMRKIRGNEISMIFQEPMTSLNPVFRIGSQIAEAIQLHQKMSKKDALDRSVEMLRLVGIPSPEKRANNYPHQLSGGMRQRVMIAMALSCKPKLMIADEPTTALDVTVQAQILDLMNNLKEDVGASIILITHNLGIVAEMCQFVCVMYAGCVVEYADVRTIFKKPLHPYTVGLLKSVPRIGSGGSKRVRLFTVPGIVPSVLQLPKGCRFGNRCSRAQDTCADYEPPLVPVSTGTPKSHLVRCWLYGSEDCE